MEYYSAIKKNDILPFATMDMDLESIMLNEIIQRKTLYVNTYMWSLKVKQTNIHSKIVLWGREEKRGKKQDRGMGLKRGINHYVQNR